jgi:hypothetical protein
MGFDDAMRHMVGDDPVLVTSHHLRPGTLDCVSAKETSLVDRYKTDYLLL